MMAKDGDGEDNDEVSRFLATFPTQLNCTEADFFPHIRVFWSEIPSTFDDDDDVCGKIKSAFCKAYLSNLNGLIQFWAPVKTIGGRLVLSASYQPFALENLNSCCFQKYRLSCIKYQYGIDNVNNNRHQVEEEEEEPLIINGPPGNAFLNRLPVVVNPRVRQGEGNPLVQSALECELTTSLFLPVFYHPSSQSSSCLGVVECSMKQSSLLLVIFNKLKTALERVCLSTLHVQEWLPYKSISGLKPATDQIEKALEIVCESHCLTLAQVWIAYDRFPFSSSLVDTQTKRKFAIKLVGYCADSNDDDDDLLSAVKDYYDACDILPLNTGEGISGKTLDSYEPRFCSNIDELRDTGLLALLPSDTECSCLVICLRSIHTGDHVDYVFEFLWPLSRNYFILLESLLLTLQRCLPSFKFASDAQLGDELRVLDVENSTGSGIGSFKILEKNRISPIPKALEERRSFVAEDCISSSSERKLNQVTEWQDPNFSKREFSDLCLCENQIESTQEDNKTNQEHSASSNSAKRKLTGLCEIQIESSQEDASTNQEDYAISNRINPKLTDSGKDKVFWILLDSTHKHSGENQEHSASSNSVKCPGNDGLVTKVEYGDDIMLAYLPLSSKLADIKKSIHDRYNMGPDSYRLQFLDSVGEWLRLVDEQDWESCIIHWETTKSQTIRLRVLPCTNLMKMSSGANQEHTTSSNSVEKKLTDLCETPTESRQEYTGANKEHPARCNSFMRKLIFLLEPLVLTLKRCLSRFKPFSGARLGDNLRALDVEISTRISPIPNELGCKMTPIPFPREDVKQQFGSSINNDAMNLTASVSSEHQGLNFVKRKLISDLCKSKNDSNLKDNSSNQEQTASSKSVRCPGNDELIIKAEYGDHQTLLYFPVSSNVDNIQKNINEKYKLSTGSYKLQFLDFEDEWMSLDNDQDWESCTKSWRTAGTENIQLRIVLRQTEE